MRVGFQVTFQVYPSPYTYLSDGTPAKKPLYLNDWFEAYYEPETKHTDGSVTPEHVCLSCKYFRWIITDMPQIRTAVRQLSIMIGGV